MPKKPKDPYAYLRDCDLDVLLAEIEIAQIDDEDLIMVGWWTASTPKDGAIAYFQREADAFRFRLDLINRIMNP